MATAYTLTLPTVPFACRVWRAYAYIVYTLQANGTAGCSIQQAALEVGISHFTPHHLRHRNKEFAAAWAAAKEGATSKPASPMG